MIGVDDRTMTLGSGVSDYKLSILFYDKLLLLHSEQARYQWTNGIYSDRKSQAFADELDFILDTPYFLAGKSLAGIPANADPNGATRKALLEVRAKIEALRRINGQIDIDPNEMMALLALQASLWTRSVAEDLTNFGRTAVSAHVIPVCARFGTTSLSPSDVIEVVIKKVQVPDERTSWEDILALKHDAQLQERARKLRLWATKTAKAESSLAFAEEHVSDLLSDYNRYLEAHRLKYASISLSAIVTQTAGMIEDIAKLRLENLAKRVFSITEKKADITLSELKAPGRELSIVPYITERLR